VCKNSLIETEKNHENFSYNSQSLFSIRAVYFPKRSKTHYHCVNALDKSTVSLMFHTEATERGPANGGDGCAINFPSSAYCCIPLQLSLSYINQHTAHVSSEVIALITLWTVWLDESNGV
jgi:hypothetical protein